MLVSRETARQTIPAAFTRRMHECHTPIQAGHRKSKRVRVCSQYLAGWDLIVRPPQEVIRHTKLWGKVQGALMDDLGSQGEA